MPGNVRLPQNLPNVVPPVEWKRRGRWVNGLAFGKHPAGGQSPPHVAEKGVFGCCP